MAGVRFRGLDPQTSLARWGLLGVGIGLVLGASGPIAVRQLAAAAAAHPENLPWYAERVFGFMAYLALAGSVIYGLLLSTKVFDSIAHRPISLALHQDLASVGLGLAGIHGALLGLDWKVPFSIEQIAIPGLAPYRPLWVAAGQVSFYLCLAVVASFYLRRRLGQRAWRRLHYVTFVAFFGATAHGFVAGTDGTTLWAWWLYAILGSISMVLLVFRIVVTLGSRVQSTARPPARKATSVT